MVDTKLLNLSLRIQLSATAVATSLVLIFVPNVETISLMSFLFGFLFPFSYAIYGILLMTITWEIFASMVFGFSGLTFPFKIIAWILIGFLGFIARKLSARYFYEFLIFGGLSAIIFDFLVTISTALYFISNSGSFTTVFLTSLLFGIPFTISHTIANSVFFSFIPLMMRTILPLLHDYNPELILLPMDHFYYLNDAEIRINKLKILKLSKIRFGIYVLGLMLIISLISMGIYLAYFASDPTPQLTDGPFSVHVEIDYNGVLPFENHSVTLNTTLTALQLLQLVAIVNYTTQFLAGIPYVQAINAVWENLNITGNFWFILLNNEFVNSGANATYLNSGDVLGWKYQ